MSDHRGPVVPMDEDDPHTPHGDPFQPPPPNGNDHEQTIPEDHQEQIPEPETPPEHQGGEGENSRRITKMIIKRITRIIIKMIMKKVVKKIMTSKILILKITQHKTCVCCTKNKLISLA